MVSPTTLVCSPLLLCPYGLLGVSIQAAVFYPLGVDDISTCPVSSIVDPYGLLFPLFCSCLS